MILYVLIAAFVVGLASGAGGMNWWSSAAEARHEKALAEAQTKIDDLAAKAQADAATKEAEIASAYRTGEANAKTITKVVYAKGQAYVASNAVISNPACFIPADGVQLLVGARAGIDVAALAAGSSGAMSGAGAGGSGQTGRGAVPVGGVPADAAGRGVVGGVPPETGATGSTGQVPATGSGGVRPKPVPIK